MAKKQMQVKIACQPMTEADWRNIAGWASIVYQCGTLAETYLDKVNNTLTNHGGMSGRQGMASKSVIRAIKAFEREFSLFDQEWRRCQVEKGAKEMAKDYDFLTYMIEKFMLDTPENWNWQLRYLTCEKLRQDAEKKAESLQRYADHLNAQLEKSDNETIKRLTEIIEAHGISIEI